MQSVADIVPSNDFISGPASNFGDLKKSRKAVFRRTIDYNASTINYLKDRLWIHRNSDRQTMQPDPLWSPKWTPEGRRLITGAFSGEFTLWNGLTFNFETILQAHESQIRCMKWSHNEEWLLTADHSGYVKYWQANMNNVEMYQAHKEPIRGVSFCPYDTKFVTCSDDSTVRIWDFHRCAEERVLRGHGSDVRSVAWHPTLSLIISGSKDAQQPIKLWDPKTGESVTTLYIHKNTCTDVAWNDNGNWFLTASRDHLIKLFDLRNLKSELQTFRGHKRDVMRVAWHPFHECLFASGSADGSIFYWLAGTDMELGAVENAHESMIWSLAWHPLGHILVSGANDFATKFWTRNRPGDILKESLASSIGDGLTQNAVTAAVLHHSDTTDSTEPIANDLLLSLAQSNLYHNPLLDATTEELAFVHDPEEATAAVDVPGLNEGPVTDLNLSADGLADDLDSDRCGGMGGNKMRSTRTIPKEFAANWASTRINAMAATMTLMTPVGQDPTQQLVSAVAVAAAAAAAVSDFTSAPQYLPPVKPSSSGGASGSTNTGASDSTAGRMGDLQGMCTRSVRPMNYLGQPPEESMMMPREMGLHDSNRDSTGKWQDPHHHPSEMTNGGGPTSVPPTRLPPRPDNRDQQQFGHPPIHNPRNDMQLRMEDRDYRDYERPDPGTHHPHGPPQFNGQPYGQPPPPPDHTRPRPPEHDHRAPPPNERYGPDDRNCPPFRQTPSDMEPWSGAWSEDGRNPHGNYPPHRPPHHRFPPPHEQFRPELGPNFHPPGVGNPNRPHPPGAGPPPPLPDHRSKFPRVDNHWGGGYNQW